MLVGRDAERAEIDGLLADAADGRSRALVVRGQAGIGKSTLLEHAVRAAGDMRVVRGTGIESEAELPFGALHLLLHPYLDRLDRLPAPQAAALRTAFGETDAAEPNRFLVGAAVLTLLADLAAETPTLVLVDDAQWLDQSSTQALLFATHRFHADPIAVLLGVRDTALPFPAPGLDSLRLPGLSRADAMHLLDRRVPGLTVPGRERVLTESAGNPLALLELGAARRTAESSGTGDPAHEVGPLPVPRRVQEAFRAQIAGLPAPTRLLLLIAATDTAAGLDTILRVGDSFDLTAADLAPAELADLISVSTGGTESATGRDGFALTALSFRHPLIRAAAYQAAPHHRRVAVHDAFARVLTAARQADRRAWHLAAAASGPDEQVARELERTARRAEHRGGAMAVAAAYDRAGRLSVDPERKARRFLLAARAAYDAGKTDRATRLAREASALTAERGIIADATHIRAQAEYELTSPAADAELALEAAALVLDDPERAVFILAEAMCCARDAADAGLLRRGVELLKALRLPEDSPLRPHGDAQIMWAAFLGGDPTVAPVLVAQVRAARRRAARESDYLPEILAAFSGLMIADDLGTIELMSGAVSRARATGALAWIPYSVEVLAIARLCNGEFVQANTELAEAVSIGAELGMDTEVAILRAVELWFAAVTGDEPRYTELAATVLPALTGRHPVNAGFAEWGIALAELAAGRCADALERLDRVCTGPAARDFLIRAVPDHVEAAVRAGAPERALAHLDAFHRWADAIESPTATALSARCRALLAGDDAEPHFYAALAPRTGPFDRARTQLHYGEWLRRRRRRTDAREPLLAAAHAFDRLGAVVWAERARIELAALGEQSTDRRTDPLAQLTPQEIQVVRLAAAGHSNKEIGARLFLSPRTVGHHLYKAYPKLGVTRRIELAQLELE